MELILQSVDKRIGICIQHCKFMFIQAKYSEKDDLCLIFYYA